MSSRESPHFTLKAHYPRVNGSVLTKSWLDDNSESEVIAEISPEVFFGPDREPIIIPKSRGGFESLGGKVLAQETFGIDDVVKLVGKDYMIDVIGGCPIASKLARRVQSMFAKRRGNTSLVQVVASSMGVLLQDGHTAVGRH